jgi:hypothetical protein
MGNINKDIFIALTTRGRIDRQKTLEMLHPEIRKHVSLFCHPGELESHQKNWGDKVKEIKEYDPEAKNLAEIREWLAYNAPKGKIIFMDDNLVLDVRLKQYHSTKVINNRSFSEDEILGFQTEILNWLWDSISLEDVAIAGLSFRPYNREGMEEIVKNQRFFAIWALDCKKYYSQKKNPIYMSDWPLKEDFATGIAMRKIGYNILITNKFAFDKTNGSNAKGGCSAYRNVEFMNSETRRMAEAFPGIITIKQKKTKWGGDFEGKESIDVIVHWKKIQKEE